MDAFCIFNIPRIPCLNCSGQKGKPKIPSHYEGQYHIFSDAESKLFGNVAPMRPFIILTVLIAFLAGLLGCSRTVTGGYADSPDGKYRCWIRQFGPYNYALVERYTVRVRVVEIIDKTNWVEKPLFMKQYRFKHFDVQLDPSWDKDDNFKLVVYDYGKGVSKDTALRTGTPSNLIDTVSLIMDKQTGLYGEKR